MNDEQITKKKQNSLKYTSQKMTRLESIILICSSGALAITNFLADISNYLYGVAALVLIVGIIRYFKK